MNNPNQYINPQNPKNFSLYVDNYKFSGIKTSNENGVLDIGPFWDKSNKPPYLNYRIRIAYNLDTKKYDIDVFHDMNFNNPLIHSALSISPSEFELNGYTIVENLVLKNKKKILKKLKDSV